MKILFLGYKENPVIDFLKTKGEVICVLPRGEIPTNDFDYLVAYGYERIIPHNVIEKYKGRSVNLHIAYLPYNRGRNPNYWSWKERTPNGVTIHEIADKLDGGDIYFQKRVFFGENETLNTSHTKLKQEMEKLFIENWENLFTTKPHKQEGKGTYHSEADFQKEVLPNGWLTKVKDI